MFSKGRESGYTKLILAGLAFSLIVLAASAFIADDTEAVEPEPVEDGDIAYMIDTVNHTAAVKGLSASGASKNSIVIPESFGYVSDTYSVTSIDTEAFLNQTILTSIVISGNTSINSRAFAGCSSLVSITLPNNIPVASDSFEGCIKLSSVVFYGNAINYTNLINSFPETINSVALDDASSVDLNTIASVDRITKIGIVNLSENPTIDGLIFKDYDGVIIEDAGNLKSKVFKANTRTEWIQIATLIPSDSNVKYDFDRTNLTAKVIGLKNNLATNAKIDGYVVSEGAAFEVTSIDNNAFLGYIALSSISIPNNIISVGNNAFSGCTGLTSITLPNQLTTVNTGTFHGCSGLISVTVPDSVTSIEDGAFTLCTALTTINLPDNITYIGNGAFRNCSSLSSITLPDGLVTLDECSFLGSGLTSVTIPGNVATFGAAAFSDCSSLTNIFVDDANLNFKDVNGVVYSADGTSLVQYPCGRTGSFVIPDGVTAVDSNAFSWSNVSSVTIPDGVALLDSYAFAYCASLSSVVMPDDINSIHGTAFTLDNPSYLMIRGDTSSTVTDYSSIFLRISATTLVIDSPAAVDLTKIIGVGTVTKFFLTENSTATTGLTLRTGGSEITDPAERAVKSYTATDAGRTIWDAVATTAIPKAAVGLVYNGSLQTGVPFSTNYFITTNNQGTYPGTYTATAILVEGLYWSDGTDSDKTVTWTMAKATLTAVYAGETIEFGTSPELNVAVTGFVGGETALTAGGYTAPTITGAGTAVGTYTLTPSGGAADNYDFTYAAGTLTITEAEEPDDGGSDQNGDGILLYAGIGIAAVAVIAALSLVFLRRR
jgi:hypothetical protein